MATKSYSMYTFFKCSFFPDSSIMCLVVSLFSWTVSLIRVKMCKYVSFYPIMHWVHRYNSRHFWIKFFFKMPVLYYFLYLYNFNCVAYELYLNKAVKIY